MVRQKVIIHDKLNGHSIDEFGKQVRYQIVISSENGIKKSDFLVDLNSMTSVVFFSYYIFYKHHSHHSCSTVLHVDPFLKVLWEIF